MGEGRNHNRGKKSLFNGRGIHWKLHIDLEIHPHIYRGGTSKGTLNASSECHAPQTHWDICALIISNSPYLGCGNTVFFPGYKGKSFSKKKRGGGGGGGGGGNCEYPDL